jgi:hypothetical protein
MALTLILSSNLYWVFDIQNFVYNVVELEINTFRL